MRHTLFIFTRQNITLASSHMSEYHAHHIFIGVMSRISIHSSFFPPRKCTFMVAYAQYKLAARASKCNNQTAKSSGGGGSGSGGGRRKWQRNNQTAKSSGGGGSGSGSGGGWRKWQRQWWRQWWRQQQWKRRRQWQRSAAAAMTAAAAAAAQRGGGSSSGSGRSGSINRELYVDRMRC
jgi:hypothetical protein